MLFWNKQGHESWRIQKMTINWNKRYSKPLSFPKGVLLHNKAFFADHFVILILKKAEYIVHDGFNKM